MEDGQPDSGPRMEAGAADQEYGDAGSPFNKQPVSTQPCPTHGQGPLPSLPCWSPTASSEPYEMCLYFRGRLLQVG